MNKHNKFKQTEIGMIPEDWEVKTTQDFCLKITSGSTPSRIKTSYWTGGTIPWLKTQELNDGNIYHSEEKITKVGIENSSVKLFPINTVLMAMYGATVGKLGILKIEATTNQAFCAMIVDKNIADYHFLFYALLENRNKLINLATGAAQQNLNQDVIKEFYLPYPQLIEQQSIAKLLSDIDSKIELNQQMNKTLEAIGQSIFKRWFIDFEFPNEKGKPYKSSGGDMIDSELGKIPKGWKVGKLGECVEITSSKRIFLSEYKSKGIPFFRSKEIIELHNGNNISLELYISEEKFNEIKLKYGAPKHKDILLTSVGTIGVTYFVRKNDIFYFKDGNLTWFKNYKENKTPEFIFWWLNSSITKQQIDSITIGSTQKALTIQGLNSLKITIPDEVVLNSFTQLMDDNMQRNEILYKENQVLTKIRDSLLPKLMSGKIRVPISRLDYGMA